MHPLILAPEFFQPLRDLGTFYHAKAQAVGAADSLKTFMETPLTQVERGEKTLNDNDLISVEARDLVIKSPEGKVLAGPLNFALPASRGAGRPERIREKLFAEYTARLSAL